MAGPGSIHGYGVWASRPAFGIFGRVYYQTDTHTSELPGTYFDTGTAWVYVSGATGPAGSPGAVWRVAAGVPSNSLGIDGDLYLNSASGNVYLRATGTYSVVANIKGSTGATGAAGSNGSNGTNGATWRTGSGVPSNGTGVDGDLYLRTSNGDVYVRASGTYSVIANLIGPAASTESIQDVIGLMVQASGGTYFDSDNRIILPLSPVALPQVLDGDVLIGIGGSNNATVGNGASATASSVFSGTIADILNAITVHAAVSTLNPVAANWFKIDLGFVYPILGWDIFQNPDGEHTATSIAVEGSLNNTDWDALIATEVSAPASGYLTFDPGVARYRYFRFTAIEGGSGGWEVLFIRLFGLPNWSLLHRDTVGMVLTDTVSGPAWAAPTGVGPTSATVPANELICTVGGAGVNVGARSSQPFCMEVTPSDQSDDDEFEAGFLLAPGTYIMTVCGVKASNRGILSWHVDGNLVTSGQDWYNGSDVENHQIDDIVTVAGASHTLRATITGKNGSSADNIFALSAIWFRPITLPADALLFRGGPILFDGAVVTYGG